MIAAVAVGDKTAGALVGPLHRAAQRARGVQHTNVFGKHRGLHAERAADLAGEHAHVLRRHAERLGDVGAHAEHALRADIKRKALAVIGGERGARLHGGDDEPAVDELQLGDMGGLGEGRFDRFGVAIVIIERHIARHVVVELRCAGLGCGFRRGDGRQRFDIDNDRFGGVLGRVHGLGDDEGDRIADIAHLADRQRFAQRLLHRRAVAIVERHDAFERAVALQIGGGIDAEHAGHFARRLGVDGADDAVGVLAAHHHRIGLAGQGDVVGIVPLAAQQHGVFLARHRLADGKFLDRQSVRGQLLRAVFGGLLQIHGC